MSFFFTTGISFSLFLHFNGCWSFWDLVTLLACHPRNIPHYESSLALHSLVHSLLVHSLSLLSIWWLPWNGLLIFFFIALLIRDSSFMTFRVMRSPIKVFLLLSPRFNVWVPYRSVTPTFGQRFFLLKYEISRLHGIVCFSLWKLFTLTPAFYPPIYLLFNGSKSNENLHFFCSGDCVLSFSCCLPSSLQEIACSTCLDTYFCWLPQIQFQCFIVILGFI